MRATAYARHWVRMLLPAGVVCLAFLITAGTVSAAPAYPVKVGPTGRYLVDQNGVPFLIAGESPQAMIGDLSEADAELFFQNRQGHGFNAVWINLLCASYTACNSNGTTFDGIAPFTAMQGTSSPNDYDLSTPNEAYFTRVDQILQLAAKYGFVVLLDPAETGGWLSVLQSNGAAKCRAYGQYLGKRYESFDNIVWMHGNDFQTWQNASDDALVQAVALGIKDFDTRHIHTVELNFFVSGSLDDPSWAPIIALNASYTYSPTYQQVLTDYNRTNFLPTFMVEANYEFENNTGATLGTPQVLRSQEYWSILSGATGQMYGNHYTWQFINGWKNELDTPGATQMAYVTALFEPRAWYDLVPDQANIVVTSGLGTFGSRDYVTAARTLDGKTMIAYVPSARMVTVDMSQLSGPVRARWYDPAGGTFTDIPGSPFVNTGSLNFTTPGDNADGPGNDDWVLVLEPLATLTGLTADKTAPQPPGATITFTATATGGTPPYSYKWWLFDGTNWTIAQDWSASNTFVWTPLTANLADQIRVWVRSAGETADSPESSRVLAFGIQAAPLTLTSLTPDKSPPQAPGATVTFTATASGGTGPYQYKWWLYDGTTWTVAQTWTTSNTFPWTPTVANPKYLVGVWIRSAGVTADTYDRLQSSGTVPFAIAASSLTLTALTADKTAPQPPGTTITFTATASGGTAPYQYKWWLYDGTTWTVAQTWTTSNTFPWTPTVANPNYLVGVWIRSAGVTADTYDRVQSSGTVPFAIQ